jgi:hypothetical protein
MSETTFEAERRFERRPIRLALVLLIDSPEGEVRSEGFTLDISQAGCRIEGAVSVSEGQLVRLLPWESGESAIAGRVVWVGEPASKLAGEAGIEFLQPIPSAV